MTPRAVAVDNAGNVFVSGWFYNGTLTLDNVRLTGHSKGANAPSNLFLAKYSAVGNVLWAKSVSASDEVSGFDVAVDGTGNVYVTGWLRGKAPFGPDSVASPGHDDNYNLFLAKYDGNGQFQWVQLPNRVGGESMSFSLAVDAAGNAYVTGEANAVTGFGTATFPTQTSGTVLVKYAPTGQLLWSQLTGLPTTGRQVAIDAVGNAYVAVDYAEEAFTFGGTAFPAGRKGDKLLAKFDPTGAPMWARRIPANICGIATTSKGEVVMTGSFFGDTLTLDSRHPLYKPNNVQYMMFLASFQADGTVQWCRDDNWGDGQQLTVEGCAVDGLNSTYITGYKYDMAAADKPDNFSHLLVAKYGPTGKTSWVQKLTGSSHGEEARAIAVDPAGHCVVIGQYLGTPVFGNTTLPKCASGLIEQGAMFLTKLDAAAATPATRPPADKK